MNVELGAKRLGLLRELAAGSHSVTGDTKRDHLIPI